MAALREGAVSYERVTPVLGTYRNGLWLHGLASRGFMGYGLGSRVYWLEFISRGV